MPLTEFISGTYLNAAGTKGFVNLYSKLTATDTLDTTSYVGSVQNGAKNGVNFGQIIGWRTAKKLVKIRLRVPIKKDTGIIGYTIVSEVWVDANQVSVYAPALDETAAKFYYSTGSGVRLRNTPSLVNLQNVVGTANKGSLLGKSDGYTDNNFLLIYATSVNGNYKLDSAGKKVSYYVHKDYATTVNPVVSTTTNPGADTNKPDEGNASPVVDTAAPQTAPNSVGIYVAIGLGLLAFVVSVVRKIRKPAKK